VPVRQGEGSLSWRRAVPHTPIFQSPLIQPAFERSTTQRPFATPDRKHRTPPFVPCRSAGIKGPVERASRRVRESPSPKRTSRSAETRSGDRERTGASSAADISLTAGAAALAALSQCDTPRAVLFPATCSSNLTYRATTPYQPKFAFGLDPLSGPTEDFFAAISSPEKLRPYAYRRPTHPSELRPICCCVNG
jgi:hypothetical protein